MGQYYAITNLDSREFFQPHDFGDGLKLMEFGLSSHGCLAALAALLSHVEGRAYSWYGARIAIAGDYGQKGKWSEKPTACLYRYANGRDEDNLKHQLSVAKDDVEKTQLLVDGTWESWDRVKPTQVQPLFAALGCDVELRRNHTKAPEKDPATLFLAQNPKGFDQPEDLLIACSVGLLEDLREAVADLQTHFRQLRIGASRSQGYPTVAQVALNSQGEVTQMLVTFEHSGTGEKETKSLAFPAKAKEVLTFLGFSV